MRIIRLVFALITALALGACTTTQSPGRQIEDSWIHTEVKTRLTTEHFANITNIDVNVTNGVVTLAGEVEDEHTKAEATHEAAKVDGVKSVVNNLQVEHHAKK